MHASRSARPPAALAFAALTMSILFAASSPAAADELRIVYLGNEGFLLRSGETVVLVDALFGEGIDGYGTVPAAERSRLEQGAAPYDEIDLVLASHFHRDHFNAAAVARFLANNPDAAFLSTEQAVRDLGREMGTGSTSPQPIQGVWPREGEKLELEFDGVGLTVFNLHHGRDRPAVQNLGLLVEICGLRILHIGDTEANVADMRAAGLQGLKPDVALLPSWYLRPGRWSEPVREVIEPKRIVAMHLPTGRAPKSFFYGGSTDLDSLVALIRDSHPDASVPLTSGDSISMSCLSD